MPERLILLLSSSHPSRLSKSHFLPGSVSSMSSGGGVRIIVLLIRILLVYLFYCSFEFQSLSGLCNCCDCFFGLRTSRKDRVLNESLFEYISDDRMSFGPAHMDEI